MASDVANGALVLSTLTATALVIEKLVQAYKARGEMRASQANSKASNSAAAKNDADVQINWMHEANTLMDSLMSLKRTTNEEIERLTREVRGLTEAHQKSTLLLDACHDEKKALKGTGLRAATGWQLWRQSSRAAWTYIDDLERGKTDPEYERLAKSSYIEAVNFEEAGPGEAEVSRLLQETPEVFAIVQTAPSSAPGSGI